MLSFKDDYKGFEFAWKNSGRLLNGDKVGMKDALATPEAPLFMPKVITNVVQEAVEPILIGTNLLTRIPFTPGQYIQFPVMGALDGDFDMAEGEEYPEVRVSYGPGTAITSVGKTGVAVKFTEEILRYSAFDVVNLHLRAVGRALARFKEQKIFRMLANQGVVTHDNTTPANSLFGTTTGRGFTGAANGSVTMDDLFEAYASVLDNGFTPNLLLMHPLSWLMFVQDPVLRAFALANGAGTFFATWTGNPAEQDWPAAHGGLGVSGGRQINPANATQQTPSALTAYSQRLQSAPQLPGYFGIGFTIVVSPFVPFDPVTNTTTIIMADANELGYYIVDHDLQTEDWKNPENDILKIKLKERYTLAIANEGLGVAVLRNVEVAPNQVVLPAQAQISVTGSALGAINRATAIS